MASSSYSKIRYVVSKKYNVVIKAIFYDLDFIKLKTLTNNKISSINEVNVVMNSVMENHKTKGRTVLTVNSIDVGEDISDSIFSIKGLKTQ